MLAFVQALVTLAAHIMGWLGDRQLISAGEAAQAKRSLEDALAVIAKANAARRSVKPATPDELHDDPYNRD